MKIVFYWKQDNMRVTGEVLERLVISPFPPYTIYGVGKYNGQIQKVNDMYFINEDDGIDDL